MAALQQRRPSRKGAHRRCRFRDSPPPTPPPKKKQNWENMSTARISNYRQHLLQQEAEAQRGPNPVSNTQPAKQPS